LDHPFIETELLYNLIKSVLKDREKEREKIIAENGKLPLLH
jgi:hypothetical protein